MALNDNKNIEKLMFDAIETHLKKFVEDRYESMKKELMERLDREKAQEVAAVSLSFMKMVQFETMGNKVVLTVEMKESK